ncbi:hypothetical protein ACWGLF_19695 [Streptomyces puniciscabiei]
MSLLIAIGSSAAISAVVSAVASYLTQHRLARRGAELDYELYARKRLHEAIGPLRFQLLMAIRELLRRLRFHPYQEWPMDPGSYYAHSFIYRLLKPLAIAQLIERQMAVADFSVDTATVDLLRFELAAIRMLADAEILLDHPSVDWESQSQHLFHETIDVAAARLICETVGQTPRVMSYNEFATEVPDPNNDAAIAPVARLFADCHANLTEKPLLWLRLVGYGHASHWLMHQHGANLGFNPGRYNTANLLRHARDELIVQRIDEYVATVKNITAIPL